LKQEILFRLSIHALPADNPQQAETASHLGVKGNHNCRYDKLGGSTEYKETDEGYYAQFLVGHISNAPATLSCLMTIYFYFSQESLESPKTLLKPLKKCTVLLAWACKINWTSYKSRLE
jgi:hypothetical protein